MKQKRKGTRSYVCYSISRNKDLISPSNQASQNKTILRTLLTKNLTKSSTGFDISLLQRVSTQRRREINFTKSLMRYASDEGMVSFHPEKSSKTISIYPFPIFSSPLQDAAELEYPRVWRASLGGWRGLPTVQRMEIDSESGSGEGVHPPVQPGRHGTQGRS